MISAKSRPRPDMGRSDSSNPHRWAEDLQKDLTVRQVYYPTLAGLPSFGKYLVHDGGGVNNLTSSSGESNWSHEFDVSTC